MNQYGQKSLNPNTGMEQLQSAMESKPFQVDEIQMKQRIEQQQQAQGGGLSNAVNTGTQIAGWFG